MTDRERDVLAAMGTMAVTPAQVARLLNLVEVEPRVWKSVNKCPWCPVGPLLRGERCASVPRTSADRVRRVLRALLRQGLIVDLQCHRYPRYMTVAATKLLSV